MRALVAQVIKTIQGEGPSIGFPVTLIRFAGCNFKCSFCDSKWALKTSDFELFTKDTELNSQYMIKDINIDLYLKKLEEFVTTDRILLTGGEPFIYPEVIARIIDHFKDKFIEIETNGSYLYDFEYYNFDEIDLNKHKERIQLNISPKYSEYLKKYSSHGFKWIDRINHNFKFIYERDLEQELLDFIDNYISEKSPIVISPMTPNIYKLNFKEKFHKSCLETVDFCIRHNYRYSPREHILLFGIDKDEKL